MMFGARIFVLALLPLALMGSLTAQQRPDAARVRQQLIGSYKLISYVSYDEKGNATKLPYSAGQISYDAAGRMSAQLMRADTATSDGAQAAGTQAQSGSAAGYVAYFGRYEIDAEKGIVTHHVEGSVSRNMVGRAMPRWYEFSSDGRTLFLSTKNGDRVTGRLQWDRHQ